MGKQGVEGTEREEGVHFRNMHSRFYHRIGGGGRTQMQEGDRRMGERNKDTEERGSNQNKREHKKA